MSGFAEGRCTLPDGAVCRAVGEGYRRGLQAGVQLAKDHAYSWEDAYVPPTGRIAWEDVDRELERRTK